MRAFVDSAALDRHLISDDFVRDPYATFDYLRDEDPVHWSDGIGGWVLTRYDDMLTTFRDVPPYSNEGRLGQAAAHLPTSSRGGLAQFEAHYQTKGLLHSDPPDHTRLRRIVLRSFSPPVIETMRPRIQQIVDELLDQVHRAGEMEVIADLAAAVPVTVLTDLLGVPLDDAPIFRAWADRLLAFQGVNRPNERVLYAAQQALVQARAYLGDLILQRRTHPADDLISRLCAEDERAGVLSDAEIINTGVTMLTAGHETTTSLIGNGLFTLLSHPDQWQELRRDPSLVKTAIEEILRFESPVARQPRRMLEDTELGGRTLGAGQMVFQMLGAANRDPSRFTDPARFDIHRSPNRHLAFGQGIHFCIGAPLSRAEGDIVFTSLLERMPNLRLSDPTPQWDLTKRNSRVLRSLPVTF